MERANHADRTIGNSAGNYLRANRGILLSVVVLTLLFAFAQLISGFYPSSKNWGIHHLAFSPLAVRLAVPALMLVVLVPAVQHLLLGLITRAHLWYAQQRMTSALVVASICLCAFLFWLWREQTHFLGDGFMIVRWLAIIDRIQGVPFFFVHEPLTGFLAWSLASALSVLGISSAYELAVQCSSIIFGIGAVALVILLSKFLFSDPEDRILFALFIIVSGASQLFFGYVENYTPAYCGLLGYTVLCIMYIRGNLSLVVPSALFGVLFTLYFGMLGLTPTLLYLFYRSVRRHNIRDVVLSIAAASIVAGGILWMFGYSLDKLKEIFFQEEGHFVPLTTLAGGWKAYSMFSLSHLLEITNLYLLLSAYVPLLIVLGMKRFVHQGERFRGEGGFLLWSGLTGLLLTIILNPDIGMSRDWDLMTPFYLMSMIAAGWLTMKLVERHTRRRIFIIIIVVTLLHSIPWITVNADAEASIARLNMLADEDLWGRNAFRVFEELGMYYQERQDTAKTIMYYERVLLHDSTNHRILANLSDLYWLQGNEEKGLAYGTKGIHFGSKSATVYYNLGAYYAKHNKYDEALQLMEKSLNLDPTKPFVSFGLGVIHLKKSEYRPALQYFKHTIKLDGRFAEAYLNAGYCSLQLDTRDEARQYFNQYFALKPDDPRKEYILQLLN